MGGKVKKKGLGGAGARRKGHAFERHVAIELKPFFPDAKRHLESQWQEAQGFDLDNTGPFKIQCKRYRKYASIKAIEEVQCKPGDIPALVTKGDNLEPVICFYMADFLDLLQSGVLGYDKKVNLEKRGQNDKKEIKNKEKTGV